MKKKARKKVGKTNLKQPTSPPIEPYYQMFGCWGGGGTTQYQYTEKELFYLTQGA